MSEILEYLVIDFPDEFAPTSHESVIRFLREHLIYQGRISRWHAAQAACQVVIGEARISNLLNRGIRLPQSENPLTRVVGVVGRSRHPLPWQGSDGVAAHEVCLLFTPVEPPPAMQVSQDTGVALSSTSSDSTEPEVGPDSEASYRLRFFFDTGSGICLWSANYAARERFDYPVPLELLPLPETLRRRGTFVIAWHDTFMDWELSPQPSRWWSREKTAFNAATQELLALLREHLEPDFELVDESGTDDSTE